MRRKKKDNRAGKQQPHAVELIDAETGTTHLVSDEEVDSGRHAGRYVAVCGAVVLAASLTAPAKKYCRSCAQWARR